MANVTNFIERFRAELQLSRFVVNLILVKASVAAALTLFFTVIVSQTDRSTSLMT